MRRGVAYEQRLLVARLGATGSHHNHNLISIIVQHFLHVPAIKFMLRERVEKLHLKALRRKWRYDGRGVFKYRRPDDPCDLQIDD